MIPGRLALQTIVASLLLALSACGGGGGGGSVSAKLDLSVSGATGALSVSDGNGHQMNIPANGSYSLDSAAPGSGYTIGFPVQPANQVCYATPASGTLASTTSIDVVCENGLRNFVPDAVYSERSVLALETRLSGLPATIGAFLDETTPITIQNTNGLLSIVLPGMTDGAHTVTSTIAGRPFSFDFNYRARTLPDTPDNIIKAYLDGLKDQANATLAVGGLSADEQAVYQNVLDSLPSLQKDVDGASAADRLSLAKTIDANTLQRESAGARALSKAYGGDSKANPCLSAVLEFSLEAYLVYVSVTTAASPEPLLTKIVGGVGFFVSLVALDKSIERHFRSGNGCVGRVFQMLDESKPKAITKSAEISSRTYTFNHKKQKTLDYSSTYQLTVGAGTVDQIRGALTSVIQKVPSESLKASLLSVTSGLKSSGLRPTAAGVVIESVSDGRLSLSQSYSGGVVSQTYKLQKDLRIDNQLPFTFVVSEYYEGNLVKSTQFNGRLNALDKPVARPGALAVAPNVEVDFGIDADFADTVEIRSSTSHGALSLTNPETGTFSYVSDKDFVGEDSFVYRAHNDYGYSDPATVKIKVESNCRLTDGATQKILHCAQTLDGPYQTLEVYKFSPDDMRRGQLQMRIAPPGISKSQENLSVRGFDKDFSTGVYTEGRDDFKIIKGTPQNTYVTLVHVYGVSDPSIGRNSIITDTLSDGPKGFGIYTVYLYCDNTVSKRVTGFYPTDSLGNRTGDTQSEGGAEMPSSSCPTAASVEGISPLSLEDSKFYKKYVLESP